MSNLYQLARHFQRKYPGENSYLVFTGVLRINRMIYTCSVAWYAGSWAIISIGNARIAFPSSTWRLQCHVKDKDIIHPIISSAFRSRSSFTTSLRRNAEKLIYGHLSKLIVIWASFCLDVPCPPELCFLFSLTWANSTQNHFNLLYFLNLNLGLFLSRNWIDLFIYFLLRESL